MTRQRPGPSLARCLTARGSLLQVIRQVTSPTLAAFPAAVFFRFGFVFKLLLGIRFLVGVGTMLTVFHIARQAVERFVLRMLWRIGCKVNRLGFEDHLGFDRSRMDLIIQNSIYQFTRG